MTTKTPEELIDAANAAQLAHKDGALKDAQDALAPTCSRSFTAWPTLPGRTVGARAAWMARS